LSKGIGQDGAMKTRKIGSRKAKLNTSSSLRPRGLARAHSLGSEGASASGEFLSQIPKPLKSPQRGEGACGRKRPSFERMKKIFGMLQEGEYPNCTTMAKELKVSVKTARRDIEFMRDRWKLPILYDEMKFGFYFSKPVDRFPGVPVTEKELFALCVANKAIEQYQGTALQQPLELAFQSIAPYCFAWAIGNASRPYCWIWPDEVTRPIAVLGDMRSLAPIFILAGVEGVKGILRTGRCDKGIAQDGDGGIEFERAGLRPDIEGGADDCRLCRGCKHFQRAHFRGNSISFARPTVVGINAFINH
jgi:hypothetical protein